ncbi:hypothetical protein [Streptomyces decoyicus]|uniref:hypothetical protein n=1 Tax=Streptomyces decoyicus TaxID=249567 RepID=UPI003660F965
MSISAFSVPPVPVPVEREPKEEWPGPEVKAALAEVGAAGGRASTWLRSLYVRQKQDGVLELAAAVEEAVASLDPTDRDKADGYGAGGFPDELHDRLDPMWLLHHDDQLTSAQRVTILAMTTCISHAATLAAGALNSKDLAKDLRMVCEVVDHAIDTVGAYPS